MFVIRHTGRVEGKGFLNQRVKNESRILKPSIWTDDITEALSFEFKIEVDDYVKYVREIVGYPVEAILTFGVENTQ